MAITSTPYVRLPANQFYSVFKAGDEDIVLTVEFKNLNQNRVRFRAELLDQSNKVIGTPITVDIAENKTYKKYNILVKANTTLHVRTTQPGFAVRVYKPALYAMPGQLALGNDLSLPLELFLDAPGVHNVTVRGMPAGISVSPMSAEIREGYPVTFTVTRDSNSRLIGPIMFAIPATLQIGTAVDVGTEPEPLVDDGSGDGQDCDPDITADLVAAYVFGRDHL